MTHTLTRVVVLLLLAAVAEIVGPECHAGLFKLDFAILQGEAEGWDIIDPVTAEEECIFQGGPTPCSVYALTDRSGEQDDDVTLEILEVPMLPNNPPHLTEPQVYDGIEVPLEALGDYHYRSPDTAGTSAPFRFSNLDPGNYRVTVFEGRTTDGNGQFAKLWVGDADGSNEPGEPGAHEGRNTGDFAAGSSTLTLNVGAGEFLWYRHLEDNSGGISGIIIRPIPGLPGDFNDDGAIDTADFQILVDNFNAPGGTRQGDLDFNGHVNLADFVKFRQIFEGQGAAAAAVPEPGGAVLLWMATAYLLLRRRTVLRNRTGA